MAVEQGPDRSQHPDARVRTTIAQTELILAGVEGATAWPPDWRERGEVDYLYREGRILVRDADLARVQQVVPGRVVDAHVRGLTVYAPSVPVIEALRTIDAAVGRGVCTPDHVLWVTTKSFCPAVEPIVPDKGAAEPVPGAAGAGCTDDCDGDGVRVSVVDTGWWPDAEAAHPWLTGVTGDPEDPFGPDGQIRAYGGHGTFAAGVVRSTAPKATVRVEGVLPVAGAWAESDLVAQLYDALAWAPDIISLQAGTTTRDALALLSFEVLYETRLKHLSGTVLLAAAGNDGSTTPFWPAAFPWATAVGGLTEDGSARAPWSNYGPWVDVYARGEAFVNAFVTGTYTTYEAQTPAGEERGFEGMAVWSGTSFATPYVAGIVASRMSRTGESARQALDVLLKLARGQALPKVGPVLTPDLACPGEDRPRCTCGCACCC